MAVGWLLQNDSFACISFASGVSNAAGMRISTPRGSGADRKLQHTKRQKKVSYKQRDILPQQRRLSEGSHRLVRRHSRSSSGSSVTSHGCSRARRCQGTLVLGVQRECHRRKEL
jgi:hypothetical protein